MSETFPGLIIVLIGPSGAGKGTQAERLAADGRFLHVATGDLLRDHLRRRTAIGRRVRKYLNRGELVPDEVVEAVVRGALEQADEGRTVVLDGYPRTEVQAAKLDEALAALGGELDATIYLEVPDAEIVEQRIPGRLTCESCQRSYHERYRRPRTPSVCDACGGRLSRRMDDTPPWARARLRVFHRQTAPVVDHYQKRNRLIVIDGKGRIEDVEARMRQTIEALERRQARRATAEESLYIQSLRQPPQLLPAGDDAPAGLDLVLLGAPGSGKGTQAERLRDHFHVPHVSTGELFRENVRKGTELGRLAKSYLDRGELVPDDVTEGMVRDRLAHDDTRDGFILDGFPRTLPQAEALTDILTGLGRRLSGVVYLDVPDAALVKRLSGRWICSQCQTPWHTEFHPPARAGICDRCGGKLYQREDDRPRTVRARLRTFHRETAPLIDRYRRDGLLVEVPGEGEIGTVGERAIAAVERIRVRRAAATS